MNNLNLDNVITKLDKDPIGWDVFDGLNSKLFQLSPFYKIGFFRLAWIQLFKRLPLNFRSIALVPKSYNSKGLALFIQGYLNLYSIKQDKRYLKNAYNLAEIIISQRSKKRDYFCVGYNFHWEARAFSVKPFTPNMIVSSFVGQAFLDLYEIGKDNKWLNYSIEIGEFIEKELLIFESKDNICFGYIPGESARVHNVNLMGARLFSRLYSKTKNEKYLKYSIKSVNYSIKAQRKDGSWVYGEKDHWGWIDNFHTGFNLIAIYDVQKYLNIKDWQNEIDKGFEYHIENHFLKDMTPKYYDNKLYPIDIHNFAQGIETLLTFGQIKKAVQLFQKAIDIMWSTNGHYFYYQKTKYYTNKINYVRWSQAWMFHALTKLKASCI